MFESMLQLPNKIPFLIYKTLQLLRIIKFGTYLYNNFYKTKPRWFQILFKILLSSLNTTLIFVFLLKSTDVFLFLTPLQIQILIFAMIIFSLYVMDLIRIRDISIRVSNEGIDAVFAFPKDFQHKESALQARHNAILESLKKSGYLFLFGTSGHDFLWPDGDSQNGFLFNELFNMGGQKELVFLLAKSK